MRIKTTEKFYERKTQNREPKEKHFIIFEGIKSEYIYFECFLKKNNIINNIFFFLRDKDKEGWSNPKKIMELLESVIEGKEKIYFTYETIFDNFFDYLSNIVTVIPKSELKAQYRNEIEKLNENMDNPINLKNIYYVIENLLESIINKFSIEDIFHDEDTLKQIIEDQSTYDKYLDKIYLIVDRDKKSFTSKQYDFIVGKTKELNVDFYVINPCFEFWLLLHFKDCLEYLKLELFNNDYVTCNNTFVYNELKKIDERYTKTNFNAFPYVNKIGIAIENSKNFEIHIDELKNKVGTNLPVLFDKLYSIK